MKRKKREESQGDRFREMEGQRGSEDDIIETTEKVFEELKEEMTLRRKQKTDRLIIK